MAMSDPSGLLQLWEMEKGLIETETLNLTECSVDMAVQVGWPWLLLKSRWEGYLFLRAICQSRGIFLPGSGIQPKGTVAVIRVAFQVPKGVSGAQRNMEIKNWTSSGQLSSFWFLLGISLFPKQNNCFGFTPFVLPAPSWSRTACLVCKGSWC